MITRLEADGFKNLLNFEMDFGPFTCIAGPNAVGKSNIFDALEFLSLLADNTFIEAAQKLRSVSNRSSDPGVLFWQSPSGDVANIRLAVEMIVPRLVEDDFGRGDQATTTYLRYEIELRYVGGDKDTRTRARGIELVKESLVHIKKGDAPGKLKWPGATTAFRNRVILGKRSGGPYISTSFDEYGNGVVEIHGDGGSRGPGRKSPSARAPRSVVSTVTTVDAPTVLAARREMQSWRNLSLEPSAMRSPDAVTDPAEVGVDGAHMASTLFRLSRDYGDGLLAAIGGTASQLVDIRRLSVLEDPQRDLLVLQAELDSGAVIPARALSDGTLRFLALCIIDADPDWSGVLCMEEPENGIHPAKLEAMNNLLRGMTAPELQAGEEGAALRQVIINTHSPYLVVLQNDDDLVVAGSARARRDGHPATTLRLLPMPNSWRAEGSPFVGSKLTLLDYLRFPPNAPQRDELDGISAFVEL